MLTPGIAVVFLGFNAGGYFPGTVAVVALVLTQLLLVMFLVAEDPFAGITPLTICALAGLGGYALLILISALWSHALGRALVELDRAWLYVLALILFGFARPGRSGLRWLVRGLVCGIAIVCTAGLITRVLPHLWPTAPDVADERLSYPVTYWNTLGLLAAMGIVLAFHMTCDLSERRGLRSLAAAMVPLLAATLFFTFSRGAMVAGFAGLVVYILIARPRGLVAGVLATVPGTIVLVVVAYGANLLDTLEPTTRLAVAQGHRVAVAAGLCACLCAALRYTLGPLDRRLLGARSLLPSLSGGLRVGSIVGVFGAVVMIALAAGAPHTLSREWDRFISGASPTVKGGDLRQRLTDPSNNGRTQLWNVAINDFESAPLHGSGAGTYQIWWDRERPYFGYTINAHSLYLQAMAELGLPGLIALLVFVLTVLVGLAWRAKGPERATYGALLAVAVIWAVHAGVDWDWEMPVVTICFVAVAGAGLARRSARPGPSRPAALPLRLVVGLLCVAAAALPIVLMGSQSHLGEAERALYASDCSRAVPAANAAIGWLDARPEPYEVLGFCEIEQGHPQSAVAEMGRALRRDPSSWEVHYALGLAEASAGRDPRTQLERALQMNPRGPLPQEAAKQLGRARRSELVERAAVVRVYALSGAQLSIAPS